MKRLGMVVAAVAVLAALAVSSALAKGASEATITGPGLADGITMAGEGQPGGDVLMQLAEDAGFFPSVFGTIPSPMLSTRPTSELGPRYTLRYTMPGPNGATNVIVQDLYPYAQPSPVTFTKPGQSYYGTEKTAGGWYVASTALKDELIAAGLPNSAPASGGSSFPSSSIEVGAAGLVPVVAALAAVLLARRRWHGGHHATT
jgi:uncharacterized protein (TIGR03382 family)